MKTIKTPYGELAKNDSYDNYQGDVIYNGCEISVVIDEGLFQLKSSDHTQLLFFVFDNEQKIKKMISDEYLNEHNEIAQEMGEDNASEDEFIEDLEIREISIDKNRTKVYFSTEFMVIDGSIQVSIGHDSKIEIL